MGQGNDPATVKLSLGRGEGPYKIGEPILLDLTFTASEPGFSLNTTTTEPASPVDSLIVSPRAGVFPWLDDQARGQRYAADYSSLVSLEVGKPETIRLPVNAVYRFDVPGHYTLQVATSRVQRGGMMRSERFAPLTSDVIASDIEPMNEKEEADRAAMLEQQIRQAKDLKTAQEYAEELDWLTEEEIRRPRRVSSRRKEERNSGGMGSRNSDAN